MATAQQADLDIDDEGGGGLDGLEDEQELALQEEKRKSKTAIHRGNSAPAPWSGEARFGIFHHPAGAVCNYNSG